MKRLPLITILAISLLVLAACAPIIQTGNNATNETDEQSEPEQTETPEDTPAVPEETPEETEETDLQGTDSDVPTKEVIEGELVSFPNLRAVDPDGDPITYTFTSPLNDEGEWRTQEGDAGEYRVTITASDGTNTVSQDVLVTVRPRNKPPTIELADTVEAKEGETLTLAPTVADPDGDDVRVSFSGWMTSNSKELGYDDAGNHKVLITATDGKATSTKEVIVTVANTNRAPELAALEPVTIKEGERVTVRPLADDPDGEDVTYSFASPLSDQGSWQTEIGDAGEYDITVTATDGDLSAEQTLSLVVEAVNRPPVIELDSPVTAEEGTTLTLEPVITDKEGDEVRVTYTGWMNSNTKELGYDDAGEHTVVIVATDTAGNEVRHNVTINVEDVNRPPVFGEGAFN